MEIKELSEFIGKFKQIKINKLPVQTFLEISGFPQWENVCSNILAFYFNPNKPHKLDDLLLISLIETINSKQNEIVKILTEAELNKLCKVEIVNKSSIKIHREYPANSKRIDIVIETDVFVFGIENKIGAMLYNDLKQYTDSICKLANGKFYLGIVLSVKKENPFAKFISITYTEFFQQIEKNISKYMYHADSKFLSMLLDFMQTIIKPNIMAINIELTNFFKQKDNYLKSKEIAEYLPKIEKEILIEFWKCVEGKISDRLSQVYSEWEIKSRFEGDSNNITVNNGKFYYYYDGLLNNNIYGVRIMEENGLDLLKIKELINTEYGKTSQKETFKWHWLLNTKYDLSNKNNVAEIISNKEGKANEFAETFCIFIKKVDELSSDLLKLRE